MNRSVVLVLAWLSAGLGVVGFVQPWVRIDLRDPQAATSLNELASAGEVLPGFAKGMGRITATIRRGTKTITGDLSSLQQIPREISGAQVPQLANQDNAQLAMAMMELLTNERQHLGLKSYAVYFVPGLALLGALLLTAFGGRPPVAWAVAGLCAAVAAGGCWKLLTANRHTLVVAVSIARGLWMSLGAYAGLAVAGMCSALIRRGQA